MKACVKWRSLHIRRHDWTACIRDAPSDDPAADPEYGFPLAPSAEEQCRRRVRKQDAWITDEVRFIRITSANLNLRICLLHFWCDRIATQRLAIGKTTQPTIGGTILVSMSWTTRLALATGLVNNKTYKSCMYSSQLFTHFRDASEESVENKVF